MGRLPVKSADAVWKRLRIELSEDQRAAFETYFLYLVDRKPGDLERPAGGLVGLTSLTRRELVERRHFGESLILLEALEQTGTFASPAIDIGSGGGFPGLPIKIVKPELQLTLLEASGRKATFLRGITTELGLSGVRVLNERAEVAAHDPAEREAYALAMARAVAPLRVLVELSLPFVQLGGYLATPKGSGAQREVREADTALRILGGEVTRVQPLELPWPGPSPALVLVRKVAATPERYPRRPGIPSKRPLRKDI
jgi:16S rRNA (guanine527-N7)-methyltransferase